MTALKLGYNPAGLRLATADDVSFVVKVQKQHTDALGFLPKGAIDSYLAASRVLIGQENDDNAGYLLGRPMMRYDNRIAPITQCAVQMDAKRRHLGLGMVEGWTTAAFLDGRKCVQCWCADDIDASQFWPAAGFEAIARRWPNNTRARSLTLWRRSTSTAVLDDSFRQLPPLAGFRASKVGRIELLEAGRTMPLMVAPQLLLFDLLNDDGRLAPFG